MSYEKVAQVKEQLIIGTKQTLKAIRDGEVAEVVIAADVDQNITNKVSQLAHEMNVPCIRVDSKEQLGKACGIDVGTATVAIKR